MGYFTPTTVVGDWTPLTLLNGWTAKAGTGTTLPPVSWCQTETTIQLRGEITPPGILAGNLTICSLPSGAWPPYAYAFPVNILGGVGFGGIRVNTDGTVVLEGLTALSSLSLNGIRFTLRV